jgi:hypothetical protein
VYQFTDARSHSSGMFEIHRLLFLARELSLINTFIYLADLLLLNQALGPEMQLLHNLKFAYFSNLLQK